MNPRETLRIAGRAGLWRRSLRTVITVFAMFVVMCGGMHSVSASQAALFLDVDDRIDLLHVQSLHGDRQTLVPGKPTVIIFWATWSPQSVTALEEIVSEAKKSPLGWNIWPINVDSHDFRGLQADTIVATAHRAGYLDSIWTDPHLSISRSLGVVAVPTVVITNMGGIAEEIERGWSADVRERILSYFGNLRDSALVLITDTTNQFCRKLMNRARRQFQNDQLYASAQTINSAYQTCSGFAMLPVFSTLICWEAGNLACAQAGAMLAVATDSASSWAWTILSASELQAGRNETSGNSARMALALDSSMAPAWGLLGRSAILVGDSSVAIDAISHLRELNSHDPGMAIVAAGLAELRGQQAEAARHWRELINRHDPR